ncbi:MAG TPA: hypothetical protein VND45_07115, partial [Thermoanaerobaculia bacterium]|nr:hypothetical protein [Thermoanaerobaculia bacterium]
MSVGVSPPLGAQAGRLRASRRDAGVPPARRCHDHARPEFVPVERRRLGGWPGGVSPPSRGQAFHQHVRVTIVSGRSSRLWNAAVSAAGLAAS